ncbi:MAG: metal-sensitive transcriptional regulator [Anaerolineae bacterium]|jgi:DNA-binding FrmR family transcriptional regulator|nr:metal-sensitive transcriptional regulator [Anaerolineae bacterium]
MELRSPEVKADLIARLHRIEGQVRGVEKMVQDERECGAILQQMAAIRSAVHNASLVLARAYAERCMLEPAEGDVDTMLDQLMSTLKKLE